VARYPPQNKGIKRLGRFEGLKDNEWAAVELLIPYRWARGKEQHPLHSRKILNTLVWVLTTGARWYDVPVGKQWASSACAHKYLGLWKETDLLERLLIALQEICIEAKTIDLTQLVVDGFFSAEKGGGEKVDYGYKGKGVTTHLLIDGLGQPLSVTSTGTSGDARKEVEPLLKKISGWLKPIISQGIMPGHRKLEQFFD
jgi:transposase